MSPHAHAQVHIEDRGYQFSDGVYEVCEVHDGHLVDEPRHMARLSRSLGELRIREPMSSKALGHVLRETVRRNRVRKRVWSTCRYRGGVAKRDHPFPKGDVETSRGRDSALNRSEKKTAKSAGKRHFRHHRAGKTGGNASTSNRFHCCRTYSHGRQPRMPGPRRPGSSTRTVFVTEGSANEMRGSSIRTARLITRPAEFGILRGITRSVIVDLAARGGRRDCRAAVHG